METKKFWESKIFWIGAIVTLLGIIPLVNQFLGVVAPETIVVADATGVLIAGVATVIMRIWFTDQPIEK